MSEKLPPFVCARCGSTDWPKVLDVFESGAAMLVLEVLYLDKAEPLQLRFCYPCMRALMDCICWRSVPPDPSSGAVRPIPDSLIRPSLN